MPAETITLKLPTSLAQELSDVNQDFVLDILARGLRQFKIERALEQYSQGGISFGAAAQLAEVPQDELARQAYARGLAPPFSEQTLQEEMR
jgi:predicted HTH domain antitoxin